MMIGNRNQIQSGRQGLHIQNGRIRSGLFCQDPALRVQKSNSVIGMDIDNFYLIFNGIGKDFYLFLCGKLVRASCQSLSATSYYFNGVGGRSTAR